MKASDARKLTDQGRKVDIDLVYKAIKKAAAAGDASIQYPCSYVGKHNEAIQKVIDNLKFDGYGVERVKGYDQRDNESWDYLAISW